MENIKNQWFVQNNSSSNNNNNNNNIFYSASNKYIFKQTPKHILYSIPFLEYKIQTFDRL
jgi:hypothetical protein